MHGKGNLNNLKKNQMIGREKPINGKGNMRRRSNNLKDSIKKLAEKDRKM